MGVFTYWPYSNLHEMNLDWLVQQLKNFISEAEAKFNSVDEEIEYLKENFTALKDYVDTYFDSLDIVQIVNDKLEEMLDDGTIQALLTRSIPELASLTGDYIGKPIVRERIARTENGEGNSFQNMIVNGDYIYTFRVVGSNTASYLRVYNKNTNELLYEVNVPELGHGGSLFIKDNILYCISVTNAKLFTFDLSNPSFPSLLGSRETGLAARTQIVGWTGANWIIKTGYNYFSTDSQFNNQSFLYTIEHTGTMQDIYLDASTMLIYIVTYRPSTIQIYDALDGSLYSTLNVPNIINYIGVSETEGIHVENGSVYVSALNIVGAPGSLLSELVIFRMDLRNKIDYRGIYNMSGLRSINVNYQADPISFNFSDNIAVVKYMEDAQNIAHSVNTISITLVNNYSESFRIYTNTAFDFDNYNVSGVMVQANVNCTISNFSKFSGTYVKLSANVTAEAQIYISNGAKVQFNTWPSAGVTTGKTRVWVDKATVIVNTANIGSDIVNGLLLIKSTLITPGLVGNYITAFSSVIVCKALLVTANYQNQFISTDTVIKGKLWTRDYNERFNLNTITNYIFPVMFLLHTNSLTNTKLNSIDDLQVYTNPDSNTASFTLKSCNEAGAWSSRAITITRTEGTIPVGTFNSYDSFTYYQYTVTSDSALPSVWCIATI